MEVFRFQAIGTEWNLSLEDENRIFDEPLKKAILEEMEIFENRFSRFLPESEANAFRDAKPGTYTISPELAELLKTGETLCTLTDGAYDPGIGKLLEATGYDTDYRFEPKAEAIENFQIPKWKLEGQKLTLDGPLVFDFGGIGKGYGIDLVASVLRSHGCQYFLVEAGGDMVGTTKKDGTPFRIALEWPGKTDTAAGIVELKNEALAVSDSFRRRWGAWHHILDPVGKKPVERVIGCAALAPSAFQADCMTSGLFLGPEEKYGTLSRAFKASYIVFQNDGIVRVSEDWKGELF